MVPNVPRLWEMWTVGEAVYCEERKAAIWELSVLSARFCCDPDTALKNKVYWEICETFIIQVFCLGSSRCRNRQTEHTACQQLTAQNREGYLRALPQRPKGTFFFAYFYNWWKKTFSSSEAQGQSNKAAVGQLPEKPHKSMAASRLLVPRAAINIMPLPRKPDGGQISWHPASCPFPTSSFTCPSPLLMCSCFCWIFYAFPEHLSHTTRKHVITFPLQLSLGQWFST